MPLVVNGQHRDRNAASNLGGFDNILAFEDVLNGRRVFTSMFDGRRCSAACYGTIFGYVEFDAAMEAVGIDRFNFHGWRRIVGYYRHQGWLSPVLAQLAAAIARKAGLPDTFAKEPAMKAFYSASENAMPQWPEAAGVVSQVANEQVTVAIPT